jgi:hypothetical protein
MGLFGDSQSEKSLIETVNIQAQTIANLLSEKCKAHKVRLSINQIINKSIYQLMALTFNVGQKSQGTLGLTDTVTNQPVQATFASVTATPDNASVFTAVVNADNSITATAVAPGSANLNVSASVSYTDSTGTAQTVTLTVSIPVTVAQLTADSVALTLTFGTPA